MTGSSAMAGVGKTVMEAPAVGAGGSVGGDDESLTRKAAAGSEEQVSEMMGRLRLTAAEAVAVVLDDGAENFLVHSEWALVGKVLAPNTLHISTISSALRPAWGNPCGLVLNPAGDNLFVAEFATKADKDYVVNGPPWVVGKRENPGERDVDGKLPYSADRLCAPDEKKKNQGARSSSGSFSAGHGRASPQPGNEMPGQSANVSGAARQPKKRDDTEASSSVKKKKQPWARNNSAKAGQGLSMDKTPVTDDGSTLAGRKRKQIYRVKASAT
ncbi:hypothetical protein ACQ4PT_044379 [Festuca glaucescens]